MEVSEQAQRCKLSSLKQSRALCRLIVAQQDTSGYVELSVALARLLPTLYLASSDTLHCTERLFEQHEGCFKVGLFATAAVRAL